jgi:hypothetical protein
MNNLSSMLAFKYLPETINRLISLYLIGLGTPTAKIIKDELNDMHNSYKKNNDYKNMGFIMENIGFYGCTICFQGYFANKYNMEWQNFVNHPTNFPEQYHELNKAKISYLQKYISTGTMCERNAGWLKKCDVILKKLFLKRLTIK